MWKYKISLDSFNWSFQGKMVYEFDRDFCDKFYIKRFKIIFDCEYEMESSGEYANDTKTVIHGAWILVNGKTRKLDLPNYVLKEIFSNFANFDDILISARDLKSELEYLEKEIFKEKINAFNKVVKNLK